MKIKKFIINQYVFHEILSGRKICWEAIQNEFPSDAKIIDTALQGVGHNDIALTVHSESFDDIENGAEIPSCTTTVRTHDVSDKL